MQGWEMAAYERLRTEIVKSAVNDLRKALRKSKRLGYVCNEQKKLEEWFLSGWGQVLSGDNGEYIIEKCYQSYKTPPHPNGKQQMPDDIQKKICADYKNGVSTATITSRYGISADRLCRILKRWDI